MLSQHAAPPATIILDLQRDNWSTWHQALKLLSFTSFGEAGQQIISDTLIPLQPFAIEPTKSDVDKDATGAPIPDQFTYPRRALTDEEDTADLTIPQLQSLPLSTVGNTNLRDDRKIFMEAKRRFIDHDTACLSHLYRHISPASHTSIKTHASYPAYQLLPIGDRSYMFYTMIRDIHSTGNAATKLHRTRLYVNISQSDMPHEEYMDLITSMTETFTHDFESTVHPGFVSIPELTSFLYLAGLNRSEFRRALDELLHNHPTGRFPDPAALMSQLQSWKIANSLSFARDDPSTQGSALIASKQPPPPQRPRPPAAKKDTTPRPHLFPTPCSWCLSADKVQRFGHLAAYCSKNPNRLPGLSPPPPPAPASTTSHRLHALLSQLDLADTPDASNAAMLLIAEAAIEASEYQDTA